MIFLPVLKNNVSKTPWKNSRSSYIEELIDCFSEERIDSGQNKKYPSSVLFYRIHSIYSQRTSVHLPHKKLDCSQYIDYFSIADFLSIPAIAPGGHCFISCSILFPQTEKSAFHHRNCNCIFCFCDPSFSAA